MSINDIKIYGVLKPWTYFNNDLNNRFNFVRKLKEAPDKNWTSILDRNNTLIELNGTVNLPTIYEGQVTIDINKQKQFPFYGLCVYINDFYYFYFLKEEIRNTNGLKTFNIALNYFATFAELIFYPKYNEASDYQRISPIAYNDIIWDKHSLFGEYLQYGENNSVSINNVTNYQLFQNNLLEMPAEFGLDNPNVTVPRINLNLFDSSAGYTFNNNEAGKPRRIWKNSRIEYNSGLLKYTDSQGGVYNQAFKMCWLDGTAFDNTFPSHVVTKVNNSLNAFTKANDTDKYLVMNVPGNWWYKISNNKNGNVKTDYGVGQTNTLTLMVPLSPSKQTTGTDNDFIYQWLNGMVGSGQLSSDNIVGVFRIKSNAFWGDGLPQIESIAFLEGHMLGFNTTEQPQWMNNYYLCAWVINGAAPNLTPQTTGRFPELGWYKVRNIRLGFQDHRNANSFIDFDSMEQMLKITERFNGAYVYHIQNDDKSFKIDWTLYENNPFNFVVYYSPLGYDTLWATNTGQTEYPQGTSGFKYPSYFNYYLVEPWKNNEYDLGMQHVRINNFFGIGSKATGFWASQRSAWETASNQSKTNIGLNVLGTIGSTITGAITGSIVPGVGTVIGGLTGLAGGSFGLINSIQAYEKLQAQRQDLLRQGGGNVIQGNSSWLRSKYINGYLVKWSTRLQLKVYNWLVENGFNVQTSGNYRLLDPYKSGRYLFSVYDAPTDLPDKIIALRISKESTALLIKRMRIYIRSTLEYPISDNIFTWIINLLTNTARLVFENNSYTPIRDIVRDSPTVIKQGDDRDETNENRTGDIKALKPKQNDDIQTSRILSKQNRTKRTQRSAKADI